MKIYRITKQASNFCLFALLTVALQFGPKALAQTTTGAIYGTVADASGAVIPNASVVATNAGTGISQTVTSNNAGEYVFPALDPGNYTVSTKIQGFQSVIERGIALSANQNVHANFSLAAGSVNQTVSVNASTTLVDTRESQLGSTIDQRRLEELPLNGRDSYDLVQLSPGISNYSEDQSAQYVGDVAGATFSTNGLRVYMDSFFLDGATDTSTYRPGGDYAPNPDALQEFRILTSNFDAEFGVEPGAVVNIITRSGTNSFHGLAYDFIRNNVVDAKGYFATSGHLRYNQFGANFGGPILHNKLFFFFSYQGLRISQQDIYAAGSSIVPTGPNGAGAGETAGASPGGERNGDFSTDKTIPKCTGTTAANTTTYPCVAGAKAGVIPAAYLDPVVQNILKSIPVPTTFNGTEGGPTSLQVAGEPVTANQYLGRGDYQLNGNHRLSFMYFHESGSQASPGQGGGIFGYAGDLLEDHQTNIVATHTWEISPSKLNNLRFYSTVNDYAAADMYAGQRTLADLGITIPYGALPGTQPVIGIAGYIAQMGNKGSAPNTFELTSYGGADTFNWTRGSHTLKFGATLGRNRQEFNGVGQRAGIYTITGFASGNDLADFLLGKSGTYTQNNSYPVDTHNVDPALFAQDDWRISPRLTLNLGLRWEVFQPYHGQDNMSTFVPNVQSTRIPTAPLGVLFNGDPGVPDGILITTYDKFAPRVGFAYDLSGNGTTGVRGGFGFFYSQPGGDADLLTSPLYTEQVSIADATNFADPYIGSTTPVDPFPFTPNLTNPTFAAGLTFPSEPPNNKAVPYVMEYNLTVEHQYGRNWGTSISYVGNDARRLYSIRDGNAPVYSPSCTAATCGTAASELARRPYKPAGVSYVFNTIDEYDPEIVSDYNSLQLVLTRRFAHNFSINANYVWSKVMTDGQEDTAGVTIDASNNYSFMSDYGKAPYDQPERFVASYLWVSPETHRFGLLGKEALSGWRLNGITTLATGTPFNMVSGTDTNYDGLATEDRPDQVGNPILKGRSTAQKAADFFDTSAFAAVPTGTATGLGNTQYDLMIGPGSKTTDLAASKSFPTWRNGALLFRAEAFNVFNTTNLNSPTAQLSSAKDGQITATGPARVLQFALKFSF